MREAEANPSLVLRAMKDNARTRGLSDLYAPSRTRWCQ